jgi:hypothetical protein
MASNSNFDEYFDALDKFHAHLEEARHSLDNLRVKMAVLEDAVEKSPKHRFGHVEAYYRPERNAWTVRFWKHGQKHIKQVGTEEEAIELAKVANEIAAFLLDGQR